MDRALNPAEDPFMAWVMATAASKNDKGRRASDNKRSESIAPRESGFFVSLRKRERAATIRQSNGLR